MPKDTEKDVPVANPPKGGDQSQASTNDDNVNDVLHDKPWVVTNYDGALVSVVNRFADQGEAEKSAAALRARLPKKNEVKVLKENDPTSGLPSEVADKAAENAPAE